MEDTERILELYVEAKIVVPFYPDDFEGSDMTFDEFVDKVVSDIKYKKETFIGNLYEDTLEDLVRGIDNNTIPVLVQIKTKDRKIPETVRDFE